MKVSTICVLAVFGTLTVSSCSFNKNRKLTTLNPNTTTPSQGVINASGNALTMGIPNGAPSRVGTESSAQNASNIANDAIGRANNRVISAKSLDSLNDLNFVNRSYLNESVDIRKSRAIINTSKNKQVKDFATMVLNDYQKMQKELSAISAKKKATITDSISVGLQPIQSAANQIAGTNNQTTANQIDLEYLQSMIDDHKAAIDLFNGGARSTDADIKAFATKNLPILKKHLVAAQELKRTLSVK